MRKFIVVWFGQLSSALGSGLTSFAFGLWIYLETGSATLFAINFLAYTLPSILLAPLLGALVDRWDRRLIMILNDVCAGLTSLAILLLFASGHLRVWHIYLVTFLNASFSTFQWMAYSAASTMLVPKKHLGRAGGMTQIGEATSMLVSPFVAGALFVSIGLQGIILIDFLTLCIAIATLILVRIPKLERTSLVEKKSRLRDEISFGWNYVRKERSLLGLLLYFAAAHFAVGIIDTLLEPMLLDMANPKTVGTVFSFMGFGALMGTIIMSFWGGPKRRGLAILVTGVLQGFIMMGFGWSTSIVVVTVAITLFSLIDPIVSGSSQAFWQTKIAPGLQGRVFAIRRVVTRLATSLAIVCAGPLADRVFEPMLMENGFLANTVGRVIGVGTGRGTGFMFILLGVFFTFASLLALTRPYLRHIDTEMIDATQDASA